MTETAPTAAIEGATPAVAGVVQVTALRSGARTVRLGASVGWLVPAGIQRWEKERSFIARKDMTPEVARALRATLPSEQVAQKKYPLTFRAIETVPFLGIASNLAGDVRGLGIRVHTVGVDRVSAGFFYFAEGGPGEPVRAEGNLIEMLIPSVGHAASNAEIESVLEHVVDRLLLSLSNGQVSELDVEVLDALPRLARDGTGLEGVDLDAFEAAARALVARSSAFEGEARRLPDALARVGESSAQAKVPLYGEATRDRLPPLDLLVGGKAMKLPALQRWVVKGAPRLEAEAPPAAARAAAPTGTVAASASAVGTPAASASSSSAATSSATGALAAASARAGTVAPNTAATKPQAALTAKAEPVAAATKPATATPKPATAAASPAKAERTPGAAKVEPKPEAAAPKSEAVAPTAKTETSSPGPKPDATTAASAIAGAPVVVIAAAPQAAPTAPEVEGGVDRSTTPEPRRSGPVVEVTAAQAGAREPAAEPARTEPAAARTEITTQTKPERAAAPTPAAAPESRAETKVETARAKSTEAAPKADKRKADKTKGKSREPAVRAGSATKKRGEVPARAALTESKSSSFPIAYLVIIVIAAVAFAAWRWWRIHHQGY